MTAIDAIAVVTAVCFLFALASWFDSRFTRPSVGERTRPLMWDENDDE